MTPPSGPTARRAGTHSTGAAGKKSPAKWPPSPGLERREAAAALPGLQEPRDLVHLPAHRARPPAAHEGIVDHAEDPLAELHLLHVRDARAAGNRLDVEPGVQGADEAVLQGPSWGVTPRTSAVPSPRTMVSVLGQEVLDRGHHTHDAPLRHGASRAREREARPAERRARTEASAKAKASRRTPAGSGTSVTPSADAQPGSSGKSRRPSSSLSRP